MSKTYTLEDPKPEFKNGDKVIIDVGHMGGKQGETWLGKVIGKASSHIIDMWIIDIGEGFSPVYPYRAAVFPHVAIYKK